VILPDSVLLAFAGYGITAPEYNYDDYTSVDVAGKVVVCLSGEPRSSDYSYFAGAAATSHGHIETKRRLALARGARGCIVIPSPCEEPPDAWNRRQREFAFEEVRLAHAPDVSLGLLMKPSAARRLFEKAACDFEAVLQMDAVGRMRSFPLRSSISFRGRFAEREFVTHNVGAVLPGSDRQRAATCLVISAHYDGLGVGPAINGDAIYNGVLDNALGVASVLEMARVWKTFADAPKRSVLFLFTVGEEEGLLGARHYVQHPVFPLHATIANLNVDGVAAFAKSEEVYGVGEELSDLGNALARAAQHVGVRAAPLPKMMLRAESFVRSDQLAFAEAGIPSMLVLEGLRWKGHTLQESGDRLRDWFDRVYHSPFDDLRQDIRYEAAAQHTRLILSLAMMLGESSNAPEWKAGAPFVSARLRSRAEKR
jgi:hypothetical protein